MNHRTLQKILRAAALSGACCMAAIAVAGGGCRPMPHERLARWMI